MYYSINLLKNLSRVKKHVWRGSILADQTKGGFQDFTADPLTQLSWKGTESLVSTQVC